MADSAQFSGSQAPSASRHRLEAWGHCQYLSAVARGVTRDELLILGLTRELALLQRDTDDANAASMKVDDDTSPPRTWLSRRLSMLGLLLTSA